MSDAQPFRVLFGRSADDQKSTAGYLIHTARAQFSIDIQRADSHNFTAGPTDDEAVRHCQTYFDTLPHHVTDETWSRTVAELHAFPLYKIQVRISGTDHAVTTTLDPVEQRSAAFEFGHVLIAENDMAAIQRIDAAEVRLVVRDDDGVRYLGNNCAASYHSDDFLYKPVIVTDEADFIKDVHRLALLDEAFSQDQINAARAVGLVYHQDRTHIVGVLLELVRGTPLMDHNTLLQQAHMFPEWKAQLLETTQRFHEKGFCWGQINGDNVTVDDTGRAWISNYGGGNNSYCLDDAKVDTPQGDISGISRMFDTWLPDFRSFLARRRDTRK